MAGGSRFHISATLRVGSLSVGSAGEQTRAYVRDLIADFKTAAPDYNLPESGQEFG